MKDLVAELRTFNHRESADRLEALERRLADYESVLQTCGMLPRAKTYHAERETFLFASTEAPARAST